MKTKKLIYTVVLMAYMGGCGYLIYEVLKGVEEFTKNRTEYTNRVSVLEGAGDAYQYIPFVSDWDSKVQEGDVFKNRSNRNYDDIQFHALLYVFGSLALIIASIVIFIKSDLLWKYLSLSLLVISIFCLLVGIFTPMMEFAVFGTDIKIGGLEMFTTFNGRTYFLYQVKSIVGLIGILFSEGSYLVGVAILLFSIVLPVTKLVISLLQIFSPKVAKNKTGNFITNYLGKWSMADVFVVALLLGFFAVSSLGAPGVETQTGSLVGLYYFFAYCMISLLTTYFIKMAVKKEKSLKIEDESLESVD